MQLRVCPLAVAALSGALEAGGSGAAPRPSSAVVQRKAAPPTAAHTYHSNPITTSDGLVADKIRCAPMGREASRPAAAIARPGYKVSPAAAPAGDGDLSFGQLPGTAPPLGPTSPPQYLTSANTEAGFVCRLP